VHLLRHPGHARQHVTKPIEEVLREARELAADGVRELILVAQDTTYYGLDLYGKVRLAELLRELDQLDGIEWIRILYTYPIYFSDELIDTVARARKIIPYLDMPLQHISDRVLRRMQRRVRRQDIEELLARLRSSIPNLTMRTTFIVGFPGETEAEFEELAAFARTARFERAGVFPYSFEPGTPATKLDGHLPEEVKEERRARLMEAQQEVHLHWNADQIGKTVEVIVDGPDPEVPNHVQARGQADAPEIDCVLRVKGKNLRPGDLVSVKITSTDGYDLVGRTLGAVR
jgi:ribosomal protein S12 methylthiotransferase